MKIYLAGGIRSGWQDKVENLVQNRGFIFYDPRYKGEQPITNLDEYSTWDLFHIKQCDIVFANMEIDNPSGIGMACEMGYAFGLGKTVIFCLGERIDSKRYGYLSFMKKVATITFTDLDTAIQYLKSYKPMQ